MLKILVIKDDINRALKLFKRKFKNTKKPQEIKKHKHYIKKSTKRKLTKEKAILKQKYKENE